MASILMKMNDRDSAFQFPPQLTEAYLQKNRKLKNSSSIFDASSNLALNLVLMCNKTVCILITTPGVGGEA